MKLFFYLMIISFSLFGSNICFGQVKVVPDGRVGVGTTTPHESAKLHVYIEPGDSPQGFVMPVMTLAERNIIGESNLENIADGLMVYVADDIDPTINGPYYFDGHLNVWLRFNDNDSDPNNEIQFLELDGTLISITGGNTIDLSDIEGGIEDANAWHQDGNVASDDSRLGTTNSQSLRIVTDSTERVIVTEEGDVGIAISIPKEKLHVLGRIMTEFPVGKINNVIGRNAGNENMIGEGNNLMGYQAGGSLTRGEHNNFLGVEAGKSSDDGSFNVAIGKEALLNLKKGNNNVSIGQRALSGTSESVDNVAIGNFAIGDAISSEKNVGIGANTLKINGGVENTAVGYGAGEKQSGNYSVMVGAYAGYSSKGYGVYIGNQAGRNESGENKLYIDNSSTKEPLIYGEFERDRLKVNGTLEVRDRSGTAVKGTGFNADGRLVETDPSFYEDADADPTNEIQDITLDGTILSLTGSGVEVNLTGLPDNVNDADSDPTNEIQSWDELTGTPNAWLLNGNDIGGDLILGISEEGTISFNVAEDPVMILTENGLNLPSGSVDVGGLTKTNTIEVTNRIGTATKGAGFDVNGKLVETDPSFYNDADADPTNEIQDVTLAGTTLSLTGSGVEVDLSGLPDNVDDADADPTNEMNESISLIGTTLSITDGGGTLFQELSSLVSDDSDAWHKGGDDLGDGESNKIGTISPNSLELMTNDQTKFVIDTVGRLIPKFKGLSDNNFVVGENAGANDMTGNGNNFIGLNAGRYYNSGDNNNFMGTSAGLGQVDSLNIGGNNNFFGNSSGSKNTTGSHNNFFGKGAGNKNTTGSSNNFYGESAGNRNTTGSNNDMLGHKSGLLNTKGSYNQFIGASSGYKNIEGENNIFIGRSSGYNNLASNNTAIGAYAGQRNTTGAHNTFIGEKSGQKSSQEDAFDITGNYNTLIGSETDFTLPGNFHNSTVIGAQGEGTSSNSVYLYSNGGTITGDVNIGNPSDQRFKENINEDVRGLSFINRLRPVKYQFNRKKYIQHLIQLKPQEVQDKRLEFIEELTQETAYDDGFIAQEVDQLCKDLNYNFSGLRKPDNNNATSHYTLAYSSFVVPLVKAVQEQQVIIEDKQKEIDALNQKLVDLERSVRDVVNRVKTLEEK